MTPARPSSHGFQNNGIESGCVGRDPRTSRDVVGHGACLYGLEGQDEQRSRSNTLQAGDIEGLTSFADLAFVFNVAGNGNQQPGLDNLYIAIYDEDGHLVFSVAFDEDGTLDPLTLPSDGGRSSYAFVMDHDSAKEAMAIPFNPNYYIGGGIQLARGTAFAGPESAYLFAGADWADVCTADCEPPCVERCGPDPEPTPDLPEPTSMTLFAIGLASLGWVGRRRRAAKA